MRMTIEQTEQGWTVMSGEHFMLRDARDGRPVFMPSCQAVELQCQAAGYHLVPPAYATGLPARTLWRVYLADCSTEHDRPRPTGPPNAPAAFTSRMRRR